MASQGVFVVLAALVGVAPVATSDEQRQPLPLAPIVISAPATIPAVPSPRLRTSQAGSETLPPIEITGPAR